MKDLLPKKSSIIIWIIIGFIFCVNKINGQENYNYDDYKYQIVQVDLKLYHTVWYYQKR